MAKNGARNAVIIIFLILASLFMLHALGYFNIVPGSTSGSRFIYIVTYSYLNNQSSNLPANVKASNYSCTTQLQNLNLGYSVTETDFPISQGGFPPILQKYSSGSYQSLLSFCLISLPPNLVGNSITLTVSASNTSAKLYSQNYTVPILLQSGGIASPLLFTIPMLPNNSLPTTLTTTTTITQNSATSTIPSNTPSNTPTNIISIPSNTPSNSIIVNQSPSIGQAILNWLGNLLYTILHSFGLA